MARQSDTCAVAWWGIYRDTKPPHYAGRCIVCGEVFTLQGMINHIIKNFVGGRQHK